MLFARTLFWKIIGMLTLIILGIGGILTGMLYASLPPIEGTLVAPSLMSAVEVARDARGVPDIRADNRADASFGLGFAHAQDRYFQMDLLRRSAAGELAALLGDKALARDKQHRRWLLRERAHLTVQHLSTEQRQVLSQYTAGVNAGLASLRSRPFEYWLLRVKPQSWREEDSLLVIYALYLNLQENQIGRKYAREWIAAHSSAEQTAFLLPAASRWDTPLLGDTPSSTSLPPEAPEWWGKSSNTNQLNVLNEGVKGSNGWLVAPSRSENNQAMLANDMHLGLILPGIWYQAELRYPMANGRESRQAGITLPGLPMLVSGSNGDIAWGFTNAYIDTFDWIPVAAPLSEYPLRRETLQVNHGDDAIIDIPLSQYGPVVVTPQGMMAMRWVALMPDAVNLSFLSLAEATSVQAALKIMPHAGLPVQNFLVADKGGHIGWTLAGFIPSRQASAPVSSANNEVATLLASEQYPFLIDPPSGIIWSANNRQSFADDQRLIGDGGADIGVRAFEIKRRLSEKPKLNHQDMVSIQFDDRALLMESWRQILLPMLTPERLAGHPLRQQGANALKQWEWKASANSVGYRLLSAWREAIYQGLFGSFDRELEAQWPDSRYLRANTRWDETVMALMQHSQERWVPQGFTDWETFAMQQLDSVLTTLTAEEGHLAHANWGSVNKSDIVHPLGRALPLLRPWLSTPSVPLSGDNNTPHVNKPMFGASDRLVVAPADLSTGTLALPTGQSGHPLSSFFLTGFNEWVQGQPQALLAGQGMHVLVLKP